MMWLLYEVLLLIGFILYLPNAIWRRRLPHLGWSMRLGRYPRHVVESLRGRRALWIHAVSVGEVLAVRPLLQALVQSRPTDPLVLSTMTPGGFEVASKAVGEQGIAIYVPLDLRVCVGRALDVLQPRILLLVESELWPTMIHLTKARGVPIAVVNGRLSSRAFRRYRLVKPWLSGLLNPISLFLMQGQMDADHLVQLGVPLEKVRVVGSLKWDAGLGSRPTPQAIRETAERISLTGQETVIVAGSTHRGEERLVLKAFQELRSSHQNARLIIAPRHLERLGEVEQLIHEAGLNAVRLSQPISAIRWDVGLVDVFGELSNYYGLATVVFIGGSVIPHGGQNPLEAAGLGKPIIFGPSMHNFAEIAQQLTAHRAARQLADGTEVSATFQELLADRGSAQAMGRRAQELAQHSQGATERTLAALRPLLET